MTELIYLSLGSNLGDRVLHLKEAIQRIEGRIGSLEKQSRMYESDSWGFASSNRFCNCCVSLNTDLEPLSVLEAVLGIEQEMGRERDNSGKAGERYADRIIDIDLLMYGELCIEHPRLVLPHPGIADRRFVLVPLKEIAPSLLHPIHDLTVAQLLEQCQDRGDVWPLK